VFALCGPRPPRVSSGPEMPRSPRRAKQASGLWAVVLKWSRSRNRYERQASGRGEGAASRRGRLHRGCAGGAQPGRGVREQEAQTADRQYLERFAEEVRRRYPGCPAGRERTIAEHACRKYSDRIGRTAGAKNLDSAAIGFSRCWPISVTPKLSTDRLLRCEGTDRHEARRMVADSRGLP